MDNSYIDMMIDSMNKKKAILTQLIEKTESQRDIFKDETAEPDWDKFDSIIDEKDKIINNLVELDGGFENLFNRVKDELNNNKEKYKSKIALMQQLISDVTDLSTKLEALEARNKSLIEQKVSAGRQNLRSSKVSSQVAMNYYNKMNKINNVDPQLMDMKS
jgi:predicted nuclease with TOPRIM domain